MGERFVYISSLGFCIAVAFLINQLFINKKDSKFPVYLTILIAFLFSIKTIARNHAWKSNLILFETDIETSTQSAKLNNSIGSEYVKIGGNSTDQNEKIKYIKKGIQYLEKAIAIHPHLLNAYLNLGNAEVYMDKPELSINYYYKALALDSSFKDARNNIAIAFRLIGRQAGEIEHDVEKSYQNLIKSYYFNPNDIETSRLLGIVYGIKGEHNLSIEYLTKVLNTDIDNPEANYNLGLAYKTSGNIELGNKYIERAIQLNPGLIQNLKK
jgi:tetratricopeptide (TPR) repeat protein